MFLILLGSWKRVSWRDLSRRSREVTASGHSKARGKEAKSRTAASKDTERLRDQFQLDGLESLRDAREALITGARAKSTWKQYEYAFKRFEAWAKQAGAPSLPCSEDIAQLYIVFVAESKSSVAAAVTAYSAINAFHEVKGLPSPVKSPSTKMMLEGIRRKFGKPSVQSAFLSPGQTGAFVAVCLAASPVRKAPTFMRAAWVEAACFRGAIRFGDLIRVCRKDVTVFPDKVVIGPY